MDLNLLYEDAHLVVAIKPPELVSEQTPDQKGFADLLAAHTGGYIGTVHRLDRGVGGVMVYAKTPATAAKLSAAVQQHRLQKEYLALVHGTPSPLTGEMRDLLFHDRTRNKTFVVERTRAGVKEALLDYQTEHTAQTDTFGTVSLVRVRLHTGRTHQIRVQFASRGLALLGDGKYGARGDRCPIALFSHRLTFVHPATQKELCFVADWNTEAYWGECRP